MAQGWPTAAAQNAGCIQSAECLACLKAHDSLGGPNVRYAWRGAPCDANCYPDGAVADEVVRQLEEAANRTASSPPFFLAAGFKRPHLGWMAPQSYFDKYAVSGISLAKHRQPPATMPAIAFSNNSEMCGMDGVKCEVNAQGFKLLPDARHAEMRRAYYSVVYAS